ncbi:hypothetical protein [Halomonas sp. MMSF_3323]|uniref:Uncharacterized protein n=1 Tax=Halomonas sp. RT37 TaxID=2950872 RepID=A0AAU7KC92_9GAMM|nr:hypothetical protein [Halomonas sp. MMSF_3323]MAY71042.1 hypothetical protein [Halomonas sp.]|tara:strand:- start:653 stop:850 length:198 start_codon:yes stop_codon:yes gene_type:complete
MSTLTYAQRSTLASRGVIVTIEYSDGTVRCRTKEGMKTYTKRDLQEMAKPRFMDRLTAWIGGVAQ